MTHRAECLCGALKVGSSGDPEFVIACNCTACQRRTGSAFGVGAYFHEADVSVEGVSNSWRRTVDSGRSITNHFCPSCGSSVYWLLDMRPGLIAVAGGCLTTPLPEPSRAVWVSNKHDWVAFPERCTLFEEGSPTTR